MTQEECCNILGITKNAGELEIKSAFKRMAKRIHPDVNRTPDAQQQFIILQNAYRQSLQYLKHPNVSAPLYTNSQARTYEQQYKRKIREKQFFQKAYRAYKQSKPNKLKMAGGLILIILSVANLIISGFNLLGLSGLIILRLGLLTIIKEWKRR